MKSTYTPVLQQLQQNPIFQQLRQNPLNNPIIPVLSGIGLGDADANARIRSELEEYKEEHKQENENLFDRLNRMQLARSEQVQSEQQPEQNPEPTNDDYERALHMSEGENSDDERDAGDEAPLLASQVDLVINTLPPAGQQALRSNRNMIIDRYSFLIQIATAETAVRLGNYLWELVTARGGDGGGGDGGDGGGGDGGKGSVLPPPKKEDSIIDPPSQPQFKFKNDAIPHHCRLEYYYDPQIGRVRQMMVCKDTTTQKRRVYHDE